MPGPDLQPFGEQPFREGMAARFWLLWLSVIPPMSEGLHLILRHLAMSYYESHQRPGDDVGVALPAHLEYYMEVEAFAFLAAPIGLVLALVAIRVVIRAIQGGDRRVYCRVAFLIAVSSILVNVVLTYWLALALLAIH